MEFQIEGGHTLKGQISVSGAKNAALKFMSAALLGQQPWTIKRVPEIDDVKALVEILTALGAEVTHDAPNCYTIDARAVKTNRLPSGLSAKLRTSILCVAPLLARFGEVSFAYPGGCILGRRPIDLFLETYRMHGAEVTEHDGEFTVRARSGLRGGRFVFPWVSHTATESLILSSILANGTTKIINAAMEPEVGALIEWLNQIGAKISGLGQPSLTVEGVSEIGGGIVTMIPDRIETGTFAVLGSLMAEELKITDCEPAHLDTFWEMLKRVGAQFKIEEKTVTVRRAKKLTATELRTHEHPGFATDLQAPFTVLLTQAHGLSLVHEIIYEGRLFYTDTLNKMGAQIIMADPHRVVIEGPRVLTGKKLESPDIRAGIALVIAALIAQGKSLISNVGQIDRGYERIDERLRSIGAVIERLG